MNTGRSTIEGAAESLLPTSDPNFYDPELYDLEVGPGPRVGPVYIQASLEMGGPVLEIGCGTGNVLLPIARHGIEAWGLDASSAMLEWARKKVAQENPAVDERLHLRHGRMEDLDLPRYFRQIFLSNDVVAHLLDAESLRQTLKACRRHMQGGGRLVLDLTHFDVAYLGRYSDPAENAFRFRGRNTFTNGRKLQVWERTAYDGDSGLLTAHFRYERLNSAGHIVETFDRILRLMPRRVPEVVFALEACGFANPQSEPLSRGEGDRADLIMAWARED